MTRLLVSVRSVAEARDALVGGADLIDLKEPARGSLGAVDAQTVAEIAAAIDRSAPLSLACGELRDLDVGLLEERKPTYDIPANVAYAKLGLAGCAGLADWRARWLRWRELLPSSVAPVAVVYADWGEAAAPPPEEVLEFAIDTACGAVLIDTYEKSQGGLLDHFPLPQLMRFTAKIRRSHSFCVLAGSLSWQQLAEVLACQPDFVAVRGAVCRGGRSGPLDVQLVRAWAEHLRQRERPSADLSRFA